MVDPVAVGTILTLENQKRISISVLLHIGTHIHLRMGHLPPATRATRAVLMVLLLDLSVHILIW